MEVIRGWFTPPEAQCGDSSLRIKAYKSLDINNPKEKCCRTDRLLLQWYEEIETTEREIRTVGVGQNLPAVNIQTPVGRWVQFVFLYFGPLKLHLYGKYFATDVDAKNCATFKLKSPGIWGGIFAWMPPDHLTAFESSGTSHKIPKRHIPQNMNRFSHLLAVGFAGKF